MKFFLAFLVIGTWCLASNAMLQTYVGYKVFRVRPTTPEQTDFLVKLENESQFDFWVGPNGLDIPVDIMVAPKDLEYFQKLMSKAGMVPEVFINDVQELISNEVVSDGLGRSGMTWNKFYRLKEIYNWMDSLPARFPGKVNVTNIGMTYEKRIMKALKISFKPGKRAVFLEGGMHAREWISPATVTYLTNEILTSQDPAFRKIADNFDWYIVPVSNPDGYEFSHTNDRFWRKTRSYQGACKGVDGNRNWNFYWGEYGTSNMPCDLTFGGPKSFSEPETKALSSFIAKIGNKLDVYLSFHSYSQLILTPYGHTTDHLDNYDELLKIGQAAVAALEVKYGTKYKVGTFAEVLYSASGTSQDWVKSKFKVPIVYTYELRDTGSDGFVQPPEKIIPNCEEVVDSIVGMFQEAKNLGVISID